MSVLVEAITVLIKNRSIEQTYEGGLAALLDNCPNATARTDGLLTAVGFMNPTDVGEYIDELCRSGLVFVVAGQCIDIAVADQLRGLTSQCDWVQLGADDRGVKHATLLGNLPGPIATPSWWKFESSISAQPRFMAEEPAFDTTDDGMRYTIDPATGKRLYSPRTFSPDHDALRTGRQDAQRAALEAAFNALRDRGWQSLQVRHQIGAIYNLAFRYQNQLGLVYVEALWGDTAVRPLDDRRRENLVELAKRSNARAILARISVFSSIHIRDKHISKVDKPIANVKQFIDLATGEDLREAAYDTTLEIEISDWELLDFAVQIVRDSIKEQGYTVKEWSSEPSAEPHIIAARAEQAFYIVVGACRYPVKEPIFDSNRLVTSAEKSIVDGAKLAKAAVSIANADHPFDGTMRKPIYRGQGAHADFKELTLLDPLRVNASRAVNVFISSTFEDFANERETLSKQVFPELRRLGLARGVVVTPIDLRWGISAQTARENKQLEACVRQIDAAYPFFLALLGDRYGWVPPKEAFSDRLIEERKWLAPWQGKSITEIEVRSAALRGYQHNASALFYARPAARKSLLSRFRADALGATSSPYDALCSELKARDYQVMALSPILAEFAASVTERLWSLVDQHFPLDTSLQESRIATRAHRNFGFSRVGLIDNGASIQAELLRDWRDGRSLHFATMSSFEAELVSVCASLHVRRAMEPNVFEHFCGLGGDASPIQHFCRRLIDFIGDTTQTFVAVPTDEQAVLRIAIERLADLGAWQSATGTNAYLVIAEIDVLGSHSSAILSALFRTSNLISLTTQLTTPQQTDAADGLVALLRDGDASSQFAARYLSRFGKELTAGQLDRFASHSSASNAAFIKMVCDYLVVNSTFRTVDQDLDHCLQFTTVFDFIKEIVAKAVQEVGGATVNNFLMAVSQDLVGSREDHLIDRAGLATAPFLHTKELLSPLTAEWGGWLRLARHAG